MAEVLIPPGVGMVRHHMVLTVDHEPCRRFYEVESARIGEALSFLAPRIEHVGSTAVPGLLGKPIVDFGVVVEDAGAFSSAAPPLEALGYWNRGWHGDDPLRRYFVLDVEGRRVAQLHLWAEAATAWREALAFRDLMRERADLREGYASEKRRAAEEVGWDKGAYSLAKGPFINDLLVRWVRTP